MTTRLDYGALAERLSSEGGFSVNALGRTPKRGVMVSRSGNERVVPGVASAADIESYATSSKTAHFMQGARHSRMHIGAWVEDAGHGAQTVFDVSQHFGEHQREAAMTQAAVHGQRDTYDVGTGEYEKPPIRGGMTDEDLHSRGLNDFPYRQTLPFTADEIGDVTAFSPRRAFYTASRGARGEGVQGTLFEAM